MVTRRLAARGDAILGKIYYDPKNPSSFSSAAVLLKAAQKQNPKIKLEQVVDWLSGQRAHTLHRRVRLRFKRRPVLVRGPYHQYQADLMDYQPIARENAGNRYILTTIDAFSRFATAVPIKRKTGVLVAEALKKAFEFMSFPKKLQTDLGKEFYNADVREFLKSHGIVHFSTDQELKAQIVERFNRTLREKLQKYMTASKSLRYIETLPDLMLAYNSRPHSSLGGLAPRDVSRKNAEKVREILYGSYLKSKKPKGKFDIGDEVRLAAYRKTFRKSSDKNFTEEIFDIADKLSTNPPTYRLKDKSDELLRGAVYEEQLQKVPVKISTV